MRRKRMRFKRKRTRAWYQPAAAGQRAQHQHYADVSRLLPHREGVYHQYVAEIVEQHSSNLAVTSMVSAPSTRAMRSWPRIGGIEQHPAETQQQLTYRSPGPGVHPKVRRVEVAAAVDLAEVLVAAAVQAAQAFPAEAALAPLAVVAVAPVAPAPVTAAATAEMAAAPKTFMSRRS